MAWMERKPGWLGHKRTDAPAPQAAKHEPVTWPESEPMPMAYIKQRIPCPECRALVLPDGRKAVKVVQSGEETAYLRCLACGHRWQLPVDEC